MPAFSSLKSRLKINLPGLILTALYFFILLATLPHYGIHEDSPFHFLRGQSYVEKIFKGKADFTIPTLPSPVLFVPGQQISLYKPNASEALNSPIRPAGSVISIAPPLQQLFHSYLKSSNIRQSFYKHNAWNETYWDRPDQQSHPGITDTLMAVSNRIFYEKLGVLDDIESYHLYIIAVVSLGIFFLYFFSREVFGQLTAILTMTTLGLFPFFFSESHFNIKDTVVCAASTIAIVSFYFFITRKLSLKWFAAFLFGVYLGVGTKLTFVFLPIIILPWFFLAYNKVSKRSFYFPSIIIFSVISLVIPILLLVISWPLLWSDPLGGLLRVLQFYKGVTVKPFNFDLPSSYLLPFGFDATGLLRVLAMTPTIVLVLFALGSIVLIRGKIKTHHKEGLLLLLWLIFPIARSARTEFDIAGSIRSFMEFLPALTLVAGIGGSALVLKMCHTIGNLQSSKYPNKSILTVLQVILVSLYVFFLSINLARLHPNENLYFNSITGGIRHAFATNAIYTWQTPYDSIYRQGVNYVNKNAPANSHLAFLDGTMLSISPLFLRDDIRFGSFFSGFSQRGEYIISLVYPNPPPVFEYNFLERFLMPVHEISIDGQPVLKIWKNEPKYLIENMRQQEDIKILSNISKHQVIDRTVWDLQVAEKTRKITKLRLKVPTKNCSQSRGIWSVIVHDKEKFLSLTDYYISSGIKEIDFPAEEADTIRFWDVDGGSCLYDAKLEKVSAINESGGTR